MPCPIDTYDIIRQIIYICAMLTEIVDFFMKFLPFIGTQNSQPKWYFTITERGGHVLMVNGYQFYRYGTGKTTRWLCREYRGLG